MQERGRPEIKFIDVVREMLVVCVSEEDAEDRLRMLIHSGHS